MIPRRWMLRAGGGFTAALLFRPRTVRASDQVEIVMGGRPDGSHVWFDPIGLHQLDSFRGGAAFSTWLTRIALNEAYGRLRKKRPTVELSEIDAPADGGHVIMFPMTPRPTDPETAVSRQQVRELLEAALDRLPEAFRMVFILRELEELSVEETAALLGIKPDTVKTRLFRARRLMRKEIEKAVSANFAELYPFAGSRCARMADQVLAHLRTHAGW